MYFEVLNLLLTVMELIIHKIFFILFSSFLLEIMSGFISVAYARTVHEKFNYFYYFDNLLPLLIKLTSHDTARSSQECLPTTLYFEVCLQPFHMVSMCLWYLHTGFYTSPPQQYARSLTPASQTNRLYFG